MTSTLSRPDGIQTTAPPIADHIAHLPEADFIAFAMEWRRQAQQGAEQWSDDRMVDVFLDGCSRSGSPLTADAYRRDLTHFRLFQRRHRGMPEIISPGVQLLAPGDPIEVEAWVHEMKKQEADKTTKLSKRTVNRRLATISGFYKWAADVGRRAHTGVPCTPVARKLGFDDPGTRVSALGREDTFRLFAGAATHRQHGKRDELILRVVYLLGVRAAEAVRMKRTDIERIENGAVVTVTGKGDKERKFAIDGAVVSVIDRLVAVQPESEWLLPGRDPSKPMTRQALAAIVRRASKAAGVRCWTHRLRHSHAEHAYERTGDLKLISATLGHSSVAITGDLYLDATRKESSCNALI